MKENESKEHKKAAHPHTESKELHELHEKLEALQKEKDELFAQLQRISADYANYQKRTPRQIADAITYEKEVIIRSLLPAIDNFERTLQNAQAAQSTDVLLKGIEMVYNQMLDILKSHNAEQIKALGEKFDPSLHQAIFQRFEPSAEEGVVIEELQKGYKLNGRVIRPSRVAVNKKPVEQAPPQQEQQTPKQQENTGGCENKEGQA